MVNFDVEFSAVDYNFDVGFKTDNVSVNTDMGIITRVSDIEAYSGDYTVTPARTEQILETKDRLMVDKVVVKPIPKEYGLITYDQNKVITIT